MRGQSPVVVRVDLETLFLQPEIQLTTNGQLHLTDQVDASLASSHCHTVLYLVGAIAYDTRPLDIAVHSPTIVNHSDVMV